MLRNGSVNADVHGVHDKLEEKIGKKDTSWESISVTQK